MKHSRVVAACMAAAMAVACGPPDRRALLAQTWTCEMTTVTGDLTSDLREAVTFRLNGEYQTKASVVASNSVMRATLNLEWNGRWQLTDDTFVRDFAGIRAVSGETNGTPMTQELLDKAADAFRSTTISERGKVLTLSEAQFVLETNTTPLNCKR